MGVVKHLECCAVVAISKPATLLPFRLAGSMPSFRALAETITGHYLGISMNICMFLAYKRGKGHAHSFIPAGFSQF